MRPYLLVLLVLGTAPAQTAWGHDAPEEVRLRFGDDARWALPAWDDEAWSRLSLYALPDTQAVFWVRTTLDVDEAPEPLAATGLAFSALAASEVYWDGVLIGRNGRVGATRDEEQPGEIDALFLVPDSLDTPGTHTLALRLSTHHLAPSINHYVYSLSIGDYEAMGTERFRATLLPLVFLGGFLIIALYYGVLYALDRRQPALLLFGLLCLAVSALLVLESWRFAVGYTTDWHLTRLVLVTGVTALIGVLLPLFVMVQLRFPYRRRALALLAVLIGLSLLIPSYDAESFFIFWIMLGTSAGIAAWAVRQRRKGAGLTLLGVGTCILTLLVAQFRFMDTYFFPAFGVLIVCLLASLGLHVREERRQRERALLAASRLEIELLKKHLQPHFLLNTLAAAVGWIEEHPRTGARFVEALAEELEMLAEISDQPLIPVERELALCRTHLELMGYRRDIQFHLDTEDVREDALVPPALFHTLVENGVTHNAYAADTIRFRLSEERRSSLRRYTFVTPTDAPPAPSSREGTGLQYVKARLEESFPGRWSLGSEPRADGWHTVIEVPA